MYLRRNARGQTSVPRERSYVIIVFIQTLDFADYLYPDVNQFSIITELLGTPPDDVIETICSENVTAFSHLIPMTSLNLFHPLSHRLYASFKAFLNASASHSARNYAPLILMVSCSGRSMNYIHVLILFLSSRSP